MYYQVMMQDKSRITNQLFTYSSPFPLKKGVRVAVPFGRGNRVVLGLVVGETKKPEDFETKDILEVIDEEPIVDSELIDLAFFMMDVYLSDLSSAFQTILPPGNWQEMTEFFYTEEEKDDELFIFLKEKRTWKEIKEKFSYLTRIELLEFVKNGSIQHEYGLSSEPDYKYGKFVKLLTPYDEKLIKNAPVQRRMVDYLKEKDGVFQRDLIKDIEGNHSSLRSLEEKGIVKISDKRILRDILPASIEKYHKLELNDEQQKVSDEITENGKYLLHGVTGSGKTEIYLQLAEKVLETGREVIILVPEISLTPQTIDRFRGRFQEPIAVLHSRLNLMERFEQYRLIKEGKVRIVVGARSAIFAPFKNLGLIVIDEEHELSYKSETNPKYITEEIAKKRRDFHKAILLLGSATPNIETYHKAKLGEYQLLELLERATSHPLPETKIIDLREEIQKGNTSVLSEELLNKINERLQNKEQTILFLNKRGHTSSVLCRRCGYVIECESCDMAMTYHKSKNRLICHLCGRTAFKHNTCPNCGSENIKEFGAGTEKLEEEIRQFFPKAKVFRMDSDTIQKKGAYEKVYRQMKNGEIDILIGTQMLSKGLDFPKVTLVGVVAADLSLNMGDYRAAERTFQLITQVSGRAGRGEFPGEVIIQTFHPNHFAIITASRNDYIRFFQEEIKFRQINDYPPFNTIFNLKISHRNRMITRAKALEIGQKILGELNRRGLQVLISGPHPSPIERINDFYRFDINYKVNQNIDEFKKILKEIILYNKYNIDLINVRISIGINPISTF